MSTTRTRRTPEQMIAALQRQIVAVKARVARKKAAASRRSVVAPARSLEAGQTTATSLDARIEARLRSFSVDLVALIKRATLEAVASAIGSPGSAAVPTAELDLAPEPAPYEIMPAPPPRSRAPEAATTEAVSLERYERMAIQRAIAESDGDLLATAKLLRVGKSTVYRRINALGIVSPWQGGSVAVAPDDPVLAAGEPVSFEAYEKVALVRALNECGGSKLEAARLLRLGKSTLYRMAVKHGVG